MLVFFHCPPSLLPTPQPPPPSITILPPAPTPDITHSFKSFIFLCHQIAIPDQYNSFKKDWADVPHLVKKLISFFFHQIAIPDQCNSFNLKFKKNWIDVPHSVQWLLSFFPRSQFRINATPSRKTLSRCSTLGSKGSWLCIRRASFLGRQISSDRLTSTSRTGSVTKNK